MAGSPFRGKTQLSSFVEVCPECRHSVSLQTYRTRRWWTVGSVPLIPREFCRIVGECPWCGVRRIVSEEAWSTLESQLLEEARTAFAADPDSASRGRTYQSALRTFGRLEDADRLGELLEEKFPLDLATQLQLAGWYGDVADESGAQRCLQRALALAPDQAPVRVAAARAALRQALPDRARDHLSALSPASPECSPRDFLQLAELYQQQNRHRDALQVLESVAAAVPSVVSDPDVIKQIRFSERRLRTSSSILPPRRYGPPAGRLAALVLLAAVLGLVGYDQYLAGHHPVWIVNGLSTPLHVRLDGRELEVAPHGRERVEVPEGLHRCELLVAGTPQEPLVFELHQDWMRRFGRHPLCVLDPSASAALIWQEQEYISNPEGRLSQNPYRLHLGDRKISYPDVAFPFEEFPQVLKLDDGRMRGIRSRIGSFGSSPGQALMALLSDFAWSGEPLAFAEGHLQDDPDDATLVAVYVQVSRRLQLVERSRAFLESRLDDRPVRLPWHEAYLDLTATQAGEEALRQRYQQRLAGGEKIAPWFYLLARIESDLSTALELLTRAHSLNPQFAAAWDERSRRLLQAGRFEEALESAERALALSPHSTRFAALRTEVLMLQQEWQPLEKSLREQLRTSPLDLKTRVTLLEVQAAAGHPAELDEIELESQTVTPELQRVLELALLEYRGDYARLQAFAEPTDDPVLRTHSLIVALCGQEKIAGLEELGPSPLLPPGYGELILSLAFGEAGDRGRAERWRGAAARRLRQSGLNRGWRLAAALEAPATLDFRQGMELVCPTAVLKSLLLCALVEAGAGDRAELLELARRLSGCPGFPGPFVQRQIRRLK